MSAYRKLLRELLGPALVFASVCPAALAADTAIVAPTEQPRSFGYTLGDVLTQRVLLQQAGQPLTPAALPSADRVGLWLERRTPRVETDEQRRRWLAIDYQIINAPRALTAAALPALRIATTSGASLQVAEWPISIGPLTPPAVFNQGALQALRPDRAVSALPTAGIEWQLQQALAALAAVLLAWTVWWGWRQWREAQRLPFASAWLRLRRLDPSDPEAWRLLHHALNASAGRVVQAASLPRLLAEQPQWRPLQAELENFYRHSGERFFADAPLASPYPLRALCRALRAVEKRQQR